MVAIFVKMVYNRIDIFYNQQKKVSNLKQKYIPLEKQSKREQRKHHSGRRGDWGGISPITRKASNPKAYNRKKSGRWSEHEPQSGFFIVKYC